MTPELDNDLAEKDSPLYYHHLELSQEFEGGRSRMIILSPRKAFYEKRDIIRASNTVELTT